MERTWLWFQECQYKHHRPRTEQQIQISVRSNSPLVQKHCWTDRTPKPRRDRCFWLWKENLPKIKRTSLQSGYSRNSRWQMRSPYLLAGFSSQGSPGGVTKKSDHSRYSNKDHCSLSTHFPNSHQLYSCHRPKDVHKVSDGRVSVDNRWQQSVLSTCKEM